MNIEEFGGVIYTDLDSLKRAKKADLITIPPYLQGGINCSNCIFFKRMHQAVGHCVKPDVNVPVTHSQCCKYWEHPGEIKSWEKK